MALVPSWPICSFLYDTNDRTPIVLQCNHTFCRKCLAHLLQQDFEVICPHWQRIDTRIGVVEHFGNCINFSIKELAERVQILWDKHGYPVTEICLQTPCTYWELCEEHNVTKDPNCDFQDIEQIHKRQLIKVRIKALAAQLGSRISNTLARKCGHIYDKCAQTNYVLLKELIQQVESLSSQCLENWTHVQDERIDASYYCMNCSSLLCQACLDVSVSNLHTNWQIISINDQNRIQERIDTEIGDITSDRNIETWPGFIQRQLSQQDQLNKFSKVMLLRQLKHNKNGGDSFSGLFHIWKLWILPYSPFRLPKALGVNSLIVWEPCLKEMWKLYKQITCPQSGLVISKITDVADIVELPTLEELIQHPEEIMNVQSLMNTEIECQLWYDIYDDQVTDLKPLKFAGCGHNICLKWLRSQIDVLTRRAQNYWPWCKSPQSREIWDFQVDNKIVSSLSLKLAKCTTPGHENRIAKQACLKHGSAMCEEWIRNHPCSACQGLIQVRNSAFSRKCIEKIISYNGDMNERQLEKLANNRLLQILKDLSPQPPTTDISNQPEIKFERFSNYYPRRFDVHAPKYWKTGLNSLNAVTLKTYQPIMITALGLGLGVHETSTTINKIWVTVGTQTQIDIDWEGWRDLVIEHEVGQVIAKVDLGVNIDVNIDREITICVEYLRKSLLFNGRDAHGQELQTPAWKVNGPDGTEFEFGEPEYQPPYHRIGLNSLAGPIMEIYYKNIS